jgi:hypothetical protein
MARNQEISGVKGIGTQMPDAGVLLDAQRTAAENAARMASTACNYTMSMNRAWLEFWSKHLTQYTELPKRFADAQSDFMQRAFGHYQDSIQQLSGAAEEAGEEIEEAAGETEKAGERATASFREETKEMGKAAKPKESRGPRPSEEPHRPGQPRAAH